jgi:hypothetical protein
MQLKFTSGRQRAGEPGEEKDAAKTSMGVAF